MGGTWELAPMLKIKKQTFLGFEKSAFLTVEGLALCSKIYKILIISAWIVLVFKKVYFQQL